MMVSSVITDSSIILNPVANWLSLWGNKLINKQKEKNNYFYSVCPLEYHDIFTMVDIFRI